jgi:hypothetical protein
MPEYQPPGNGIYTENPGFVNPAKLDFHIQPDSQILKDFPNFQPIPQDKIGLYVDEYRKSSPPMRKSSDTATNPRKKG